MDSVPALHGTVPAGPLDVSLHFNSRLDQARSRLVLRGQPVDQALALAPGGPADQLAAHITLPSGEYTLRWQVLATDGHLTRGDVPFSVGPKDGVYSATRP